MTQNGQKVEGDIILGPFSYNNYAIWKKTSISGL
jgi:hypothetical protein